MDGRNAKYIPLFTKNKCLLLTVSEIFRSIFAQTAGQTLKYLEDCPMGFRHFQKWISPLWTLGQLTFPQRTLPSPEPKRGQK